MKYILILAFISLVLAAKYNYGELSAPKTAKTVSNKNITITYYTDKTNIYFIARLNHYGYFALLYGVKMRGGDYTVIQIGKDNVITCRDQHSTRDKAWSKPVPDKVNNVKMLGYSTDYKSFITVKWSRPLDTKDKQDQKLVLGTKKYFVYAFRKGSLVMHKHLAGEKGGFLFRL